MSIWNRVTSLVIEIGRQALKNTQSASTKRRKYRRSPKSASQLGNQKQETQAFHLPLPHEQAIEYDVHTLGLPQFTYAPIRNDAPDPGEVVWAWVPYEENDGRGKDRPVLVVAMYGPDHVVFAQTTSKDHDHDADDEAHWGRYWMDIGSGDWDDRHRQSEVRLNRLLIAHVDQIRRTGGKLDQQIYATVVREIQSYLR
ncbi:type II toxin-antitoxin system PemK/MazF family toxin [Arcanobacterium pinnipediorum]|uniref:Type II toxin-antitoxin system PemK/MazF family toxin n=1 Tax=Arcanobacterium pinnipediorum TaxID=1503041 RepID=A0ABY5AEX9_9ACTO|nr:type II toxin-antitoxin system PemK/MazF family toxin [Arcanobacterium pinnipediorum]USR78753.1 type II toxin-antitoxin system PemK/MazF family toxin [Arcanobacterium pinnipediorum]